VHASQEIADSKINSPDLQQGVNSTFCSLTHNKGGQICKDIKVSASSVGSLEITVIITNNSKQASYTFSGEISYRGNCNNGSIPISINLNPNDSKQFKLSPHSPGTYTVTTTISDLCTYVCSNIEVVKK